jgi:hypothetical protein
MTENRVHFLAQLLDHEQKCRFATNAFISHRFAIFARSFMHTGAALCPHLRHRQQKKVCLAALGRHHMHEMITVNLEVC